MENQETENVRKLILDSFPYSISAHNVQPFRIRWQGDKELEIWAEQSRLLPAADPKMKDLIKSAGATFEALRLYLGSAGYSLEVVESVSPAQVTTNSHGDAFIARFRFSPGSPLSQQEVGLAKQLPRRFSYRGFFQNNSPVTFNTVKIDKLELVFLADEKKKTEIGRLYDDLNIRFLNLPGYATELSSWLRLSPRHPQWSVDGLNAKAMSLPPFDAFGASFIFKPAIFKLVNALGLAKLLMAERPKIESASALVTLAGHSTEAFEIGREFLRGWLALTEMNLFGAPLSLLTDDEKATEEVKRVFGLPSNSQVYNVLRVGPLPSGYSPPAPARRRVTEILLPEGK